jgi:hypothetical protein
VGRKHVYNDLEPYICLFVDCDLGLHTFQARREWKDHEFKTHRMNAEWHCNLCQGKFNTQEVFRGHIYESHDNDVAKSQVEEYISVSKRLTTCKVENELCPFCLTTPSQTEHGFASHVGKHQQEISLAALPRLDDDSDDEGGAEDDDDPDDDGDSDDNVAKYDSGFGESYWQKPESNWRRDSPPPRGVLSNLSLNEEPQANIDPIFDEKAPRAKGIEQSMDGNNVDRADPLGQSNTFPGSATNAAARVNNTHGLHDWDEIFAGLDDPKPEIAGPRVKGKPNAPGANTEPPDWNAFFARLRAPQTEIAGPSTSSPLKTYTTSVPAKPQIGRELVEAFPYDDPYLKKMTRLGYDRTTALYALEKYDYWVERVSPSLSCYRKLNVNMSCRQ